MNIMNKKEVQIIFNQLNFNPKKRLGQNFLIDSNLSRQIITEANLNKNDIVLEVGTGLGFLTSELISYVKKVYSYEIDSILFQYTAKKLSHLKNLELINSDILKSELPYHNKVVSNIPYSISGPIIEKIFYNEHPPEGILIIEKNIADRIFISGNYKNLSRISITFNAFMEPLKKINISSHSFYPRPKIDLALIKVKPKVNLNSFLLERENREFFLRFVAGIMPYKNKDLSNALVLFFRNIKFEKLSKLEISRFLKELNVPNNKLFQFNVDDLINLCAKISDRFYRQTNHTY